MSSEGKVIIVTGSSAGLGKAIAALTAARPEKLTLLATSRKAIDLGLKPANPESRVAYPALDVTSRESVNALAQLVETRYGGRVDVLILNAGGNPTEGTGDSMTDEEKALANMELNYYAALKMIDAFAPNMPKGARISIVGSATSWQMKKDAPLIKAVETNPKMSTDDLNSIAEEFLKNPASANDGWLREGDCFAPAYTTSKAFLNVLTAIKAREFPDLFVNVACPGVVESRSNTRELRSGTGWVMKTPQQGARVPLRLAFEDIDGISGKFWTGRTSADTGPGVVTEDWSGKEIIWDLEK